jgi:hypothetical protein
VPILGPDIIDPRQMDLIRRQAELGAQGKQFAVREVPVLTSTRKLELKKVAVTAADGGALADGADGELQAARLARRQEALARRRAHEAAKGG